MLQSNIAYHVKTEHPILSSTAEESPLVVRRYNDFLAHERLDRTCMERLFLTSKSALVDSKNRSLSTQARFGIFSPVSSNTTNSEHIQTSSDSYLRMMEFQLRFGRSSSYQTPQASCKSAYVQIKLQQYGEKWCHHLRNLKLKNSKIIKRSQARSCQIISTKPRDLAICWFTLGSSMTEVSIGDQCKSATTLEVSCICSVREWKDTLC